MRSTTNILTYLHVRPYKEKSKMFYLGVQVMYS